MIDHKGNPGSEIGPGFENILKRRRFGACDHANRLRIARQFFFKRSVKETFGQKLAFERFEFGKKRTVAGSLHGNDVELQLTPHLKDIKRAGENHRITLIGQSFQPIGIAAPDHAMQNRIVFVVLEIQIDVTGRIGFDGMDLAFDANQSQTIQAALDAAQN